MHTLDIKNFLQDKNIFVLSPHFDDAVLSMGWLLYLLKNHKHITVLTVFTKAHKGPYTYAAKKNIHDAGFKDAVTLFQKRAEEDKNAFFSINKQFLHLNFVDALFRKKQNKTFLGKYLPEFDHLYPTYTLHITKRIAKHDTTEKLLKNKLQKIIKKNVTVFVPLAIGNHVDHVIVKSVCQKLFQEIIYYGDFPYSLHTKKIPSISNEYTKVLLPVNISQKRKLITKYTSQIPLLFGQNTIPNHSEVFFIKTYDKFAHK